MSHLTRGPISIDVLVREVGGPERGGTCVFLGTVRDAPEDGGVTGIEYSAYDAMADAEFDRILAEATKRWPESRIALRHRLGLVETQEASIIIAAAAPHRAHAVDACRHGGEAVKKRRPLLTKGPRAAGAAPCVETH